MSIITSGSVFSTGGRIFDNFRSSLTPKMVEALICTHDCLHISKTPVAVEESLLGLEEMEEG